MKSRMTLSLLLALFVAALAAAQNQTPAKPAPETPGSEKKGALFFVQTAAAVADSVQFGSLNGYLAIHVDEKNWAEGLKDGDLGPFLKLKEAKPGRGAALFFSPAKDAAVCVFFDGNDVFGVTAVRAGANGKIDAADIAAAYKAVDKALINQSKGHPNWLFTESDVNTDAGQPLPAFVVTIPVKPIA